MDEEEGLTPKMLEVLPLKMVYNALHQGISLAPSTTAKDTKSFKKYLVKNRRFKREAVESLNRAASLFVLYITTIAHNIAKTNKRSTVLERDIMEALRSTMFWEIEQRILSNEIDPPAKVPEEPAEDPNDVTEFDEIFGIVDEEDEEEVEENAINENNEGSDIIVEDP